MATTKAQAQTASEAEKPAAKRATAAKSAAPKTTAAKAPAKAQAAKTTAQRPRRPRRRRRPPQRRRRAPARPRAAAEAAHEGGRQVRVRRRRRRGRPGRARGGRGRRGRGRQPTTRHPTTTTPSPIPVEPHPTGALVLRAVDDEDEVPVYSAAITGATADPVKDYLKQIGKVALLNAAEEVELAMRIEAGLFAEEKLSAHVRRREAFAARSRAAVGREGRPARQEPPARREPAPRGLARQALHRSRHAVPRPHPGGQPGPHPCGREVRLHQGLQVLDVRHVVDPPGDHARHGRPGPHHPHPGAHGRGHQQARPRAASDAAGPRSRAHARRAQPRARHDPREGHRGAEVRARAHLAAHARSAKTATASSAT